jgi:hypothetical protein
MYAKYHFFVLDFPLMAHLKYRQFVRPAPASKDDLLLVTTKKNFHKIFLHAELETVVNL